MCFQGNNTTINLYPFTSRTCFEKSHPITLKTQTLDSVGQPIKSRVTINLFSDRLQLDHDDEITKQLSQIFVRMLEQPDFE